MRRALLCLALFAPLLPPACAYSVLTHEAIIDSAWDANIKPLLLKRFPQATPAELIDAHANAYAGAIMQDMGYYPFGSKFFSDLAHYVRSGDFVLNLLRDAQTLNEYAFALGSLAHYAADTSGHALAVNRSVPIEYPKLRRKYGDVVTYEDNPTAHLRVEFSFDVVQVAHGNYAPDAYHDFIGFKVSKELLDRAFRDTYGLEMGDVFTSVDLAIGTYRHAVSAVLPTITKAAWAMNKKDLVHSRPGLTKRKFIYNLSRASYRKEWDDQYEKPGIGARILAFFIRILPKIGPLKTLAFKPPTAPTEHLFEESFNKTLEVYRGLLKELDAQQLQLVNRDFDTGNLTQPGEYKLADNTYSELAVKLAAKDPASIEPGVRENVLAFFQDLNQPYGTKDNPKEWRETLEAIQKLRGVNQTR